NPTRAGVPSKPFSTPADLVDFVRRMLGSLVWALLAVSIAVLPFLAGAASATAPRPLASPAGVLLVTFDIQVDAGAADYVHRAAQAAIASNQDLVIVMNTPGGLLANMQQIVRSIQDVQDARLAVYTYVPPVALAASVGLVNGTQESLGAFLTAVGLGTATITTFDEPLYDRFLSFISDPTVDGLFILVGIIALVLDLFHRTLFLSVAAVIFIALGFL